MSHFTTGSADRIRPAADSPRGSFLGTVLANRTLCTDHYRLTLCVPRFPASTPGQFVQLDCRASSEDCTPHAFDWPPARTQDAETRTQHLVCDPDFLAPTAYLRRPFSIADQRAVPGPGAAAEIDIIHRVVGRGTGHLARLEPGHTLSLLGPLGIGFSVPPDLHTACLVGGGVGVPPMLYLAKSLAAHSARRVAFLGAQRQDLLAVTLTAAPDTAGAPALNVAELAPVNCSAAITTDDGSVGMKGYVTGALRQFLRAQAADMNARTIVYCCGPTPMMKATAKVAAEFGVACQVSLEQPMACGMGTCQSCIIRYRPHSAPADADWKYKLTCTEGPVFDTRDIVW